MKRYYRLIFIVLLIGFSFLLSACGLTGGNQTANLQVKSAHYLNPDINGRASPVVVTVYQLKTPFAFQQASYDALASNSGKILGSDLLDMDTFEIRPSTNKELSVTLTPNTEYLGIIAAYRNINQAVSWHKAVKVSPGSSINIDLESQSMIVSKSK